MKKVTKDCLREVFQKRNSFSSKYDNGFLLILGGGEYYTGAPAISGLAALRSGVDMVRIMAPKRASDIIASFSPNLATFSLKGDLLEEEDLVDMLSLTKAAENVAKDKVAVLVGGGLGRSLTTQKTVADYLTQIKVKKIIDADGIYAIADNPLLAKGCLVTPRIHEFFVLTKKDIQNLSFEEKSVIIQEEALRLGCVMLLTGEKDIISDGKETFFNETGSPCMTVAGTGDTLSGIAGSLISQGIDLFSAAKASAFLNGMAGERSAKKFGVGMLSTDLIEEIPLLIKEYGV